MERGQLERAGVVHHESRGRCLGKAAGRMPPPTPASRKFHGTMRSARRSRARLGLGLALPRTARPRATMERSLVSRAARASRARRSRRPPPRCRRTRRRPSPRSTAKGSPVRVDWLTIAQPRSTTPSMQTGMPERTATTSPATSSEDAGTDALAVPLDQLHRLGRSRVANRSTRPPSVRGCSPPASRPDPGGTSSSPPSWGRAARRTCRWPRRREPERRAVRGKGSVTRRPGSAGSATPPRRHAERAAGATGAPGTTPRAWPRP